MDIVAHLIEIAAGFLPMIVVVAALLVLFWAASKLFPSIGEWLRNTDDMPEADYDKMNYDRIRTTPTRETNLDTYC
jgi:hypothetical protein